MPCREEGHEPLTHVSLASTTAWPVVFISADGVCVPAPPTVSSTAARDSCAFLRAAMEAGETHCLVPVARATVIQLFWTYVALTSSPPPSSLTEPDTTSPPNRPVTSTVEEAGDDPHNAGVLGDWGRELTLPYRDAWVEAERARRARERAARRSALALGVRAAPEIRPPSPSPQPARDTGDVFSYTLDPLSCGRPRPVAGAENSYSGSSTASQWTPARLPCTAVPPLTATAARLAETGPGAANAEAARPAVSAEYYANLLIPLLAPQAVAPDGNNNNSGSSAGAGDSLAAALTPPYDVADFVPDHADQHFVRHVVAPHAGSPSSVSRAGCAECAATPLRLTAPQQNQLLELIVLAEWLGHGRLYRVCVHALACWLSQSSVDDLLAVFDSSTDAGAVGTAAKDESRSLPTAVAKPPPETAKAQSTAPAQAKGLKKDGNAGGPALTKRAQARLNAQQQASRSAPNDTTDAKAAEPNNEIPRGADATVTAMPDVNRPRLSGQQRVVWLANMKLSPSWLAPPLSFPPPGG